MCVSNHSLPALEELWAELKKEKYRGHHRRKPVAGHASAKRFFVSSRRAHVLQYRRRQEELDKEAIPALGAGGGRPVYKAMVVDFEDLDGFVSRKGTVGSMEETHRDVLFANRPGNWSHGNPWWPRITGNRPFDLVLRCDVQRYDIYGSERDSR